MNFLKRHYEKLILAVALLVLIAAATYLVLEVSKLNRDIQNAPAYVAPKGKGIRSEDDGPYKRTLANLRNPAIWTNTASTMFVPYEPPSTPQATNTGTVVTTAVSKVITLHRIVRQPFPLLFKAYRWDEATKAARMFQINLLTKPVSIFVENVGDPVADRFEKTDYKVVQFEHKTELVKVAGLTTEREEDVSELTVQKEDGKPVVLVLNKIAAPDPVAHVQCGTDGPVTPLKTGDTFTCFGRGYKVVDIAATQVIVLDTKTGEKQTLSPR